MMTRSTALLVGLALALADIAISPMPSSAQTPQSAEPVSYGPLFHKFLATRPELAEDAKFVEEYSKFTRCEEWRKVHDNEFKFKDFLAGTKGRLKDDAAKPVGSLFSIKTSAKFLQYDFQTEQFPFRPFSEGSEFAIEMGDYLRSAPMNLGMVSNCMPMYEKWPAKIGLRISNPWVIDGLPMAKADAQKLVERDPALYSRQIPLNIVIKVTAVGDAKSDVGHLPYIGYADAVADAEIVAATVEDGGQASKTIWTMDGAYMKARAAAQEAGKQAEAAELAGSVDATPEAVQAYVQRFSSAPAAEMPKLSPDDQTLRLAVSVGVSLKRADGSFAGSYDQAATADFDLRADSAFTLRGSQTPIRLANVADFKEVKIPANVADFARGAWPNVEITLFLRPTGYVRDQYLGTYMMANVTMVLVKLVKNGPTGPAKLSWPVMGTQPPAPYNPFGDQRTAADFDVLGVKAGMSPDEVRTAVEKELGQKLVFDEKAMTMVSPAPECELTFDSNKTPPGRKCFKGDFRVKEKGMFGAKLGLARATYRQVLYKKPNAETAALLTGKYGQPAFEADGVDTGMSNPLGGVLNSMGQAYVRKSEKEWGKRLTTDRKGMTSENVKAPVHVLEAEIARNGDMVHLTITLTGDLMANELNAANAASDAAKKADEERKKNADVKL